MDGRVWLDVSSGRAHSQAGEFAREGASPYLSILSKMRLVYF